MANTNTTKKGQGKKTSNTKTTAKKSDSNKSTSKKNSSKKSTKNGTSSSKYVGSKKNKNSSIEDYKNAIMLFYLFSTVILGAFGIIGGDNLWASFREKLLSFFGIGFYVLIFETAFVGVRLALGSLKRSFLVTNLSGFFVICSVDSIVHIIKTSIGSGSFEIWKDMLFKSLSCGENGFGFYGGVLGAFFGGGAFCAFGKTAGLVSMILLLLVSGYFHITSDSDSFGESVANAISGSKDKISDYNEQFKLKSDERRQRREAIIEFSRKQSQEKERQREETRRKIERESFDFNRTEIKNDPEEFSDISSDGSSLYPNFFGNNNSTYDKDSKPIISRGRGGSFDNNLPKDDEVRLKEYLISNLQRTGYLESDVSAREEAEVQLNDDLFGELMDYLSSEKGGENIFESEKDFENILNEEKADKSVTPSAAAPAPEKKEKSSEIIESAIERAESIRQKNLKDVETYTEVERQEKEYTLPPIDCLNEPKTHDSTDFSGEMQITANRLVEILKSFGVETELTGASCGPSVTRYELRPAPGVKISKITNLADDIALGLASTGVRIEAPIPNKAAVGIEVPNKNRATVTFRELVASKEFKSNRKKLLTVALGKDIAGNICLADLSKMPHLLIAGTTGSGKSVCLNCMITSILYNATPDQVKFLMIDPKQVEFTVYNGIPHLLVPVITDARKAAGSLSWAVGEMENRYKAFTQFSVRDISAFNKYAESHPEVDFMPQIVVFIDELNDLMMVSPKDVEDSICRLAQKARAAGIHLVVATQRPSVDVITGLIKSNIPSRISLSVSSQVDSRTILDSAGAEKLLGNGDMLFAPMGVTKPLRIQGAYLSDEEIVDVVSYIKDQVNAEYDDEIMEEIEKNAVADTSKKKGASSDDDEKNGDVDPLFDEALNIFTKNNTASTTVLQRKLRVGYSRAARIVDELQEAGYISAPQGNNKAREVLISRSQYLEMKAGSSAGGEAAEEDYDILSD